MWPVFISNFNFEFLSNDAGGVVHLITWFLHQFFTIVYVLGCVKKLEITAFRAMFNHVNVASIRLTIQFRAFEKWWRRCGASNQFISPPILRVLGCVRKLEITPFRRMSHLVNVASIRLTIQFRVFEQWCRRCGTSHYFISPPVLHHYLCSWVR